MLQNNQFLFFFKVVLVGNSGVGKSSIFIRYADNQFTELFMTTIGVDFRFKQFSLQSNKIKLQIWDTAGQQRFRTLTNIYYKGAHAIMIVFNITDKQSYKDAIDCWLKQIKDYCPPETSIVLIGNKSDLKQQRTVSHQQIQTFIENNSGMEYIETSAKNGVNIQEAFNRIASKLVKEGDLKEDRKKKNEKQKTTLNKISEKEGLDKKPCCNV